MKIFDTHSDHETIKQILIKLSTPNSSQNKHTDKKVFQTHSMKTDYFTENNEIELSYRDFN